MSKKSEPGMFDVELRCAQLSEHGDPLEKLNQTIRWEDFREILLSGLNRKAEKSTKGGAPAFDEVMMFKILILQNMNNLSDSQTEYWIKDRLSVMRFLGLRLSDKVPDEKTIWLFRDTLAKSGSVEKLFNKFSQVLEESRLIMKKGSSIDASFIEAERQRNTKAENDQIKKSETPDDWKDNQPKLSQKDLDARWTKKNDQSHYGYKDHVKIDNASKLITKYSVTAANVHDSQALSGLLCKEDEGKTLYADSAYRSAEISDLLSKKGIMNKIHERGYRDHPLSEKQKRDNRKKSKIRARIEHVFGFLSRTVKSRLLRCIGLTRARAVIGLSNLVYNFSRYAYLTRQRAC